MLNGFRLRVDNGRTTARSSAHPEASEGRSLIFRALRLLLLIPPGSVVLSGAQTLQFLPEIDAHYKVNQSVRLVFQAKETREAGDPTQAVIGPSVDLFLKPLVSLKKIPIFDPDLAKAQVLQLSAGYRYVPSMDKPTVNRVELEFTSNLPLGARLLASDRNLADLDWSRNPFAWRYRNRLKIQGAISIGSYKPAPWASGEVFYQSTYQKWSTTALYAGCLFPIRAHFSVDLYYEHQNLTGKHPNQHLNQLGAVLNMHFAKPGKR